MARRLGIALILLVTLVFPAAAAREILIDVKREGGFLRWEDDVLHISEFEATSDQYVLAGLTGRYDRNEEIFLATGTADRPALLSRSGESAFSVTASEKIDIDFGEESLRAEGQVRYTSGEVEASCRLLIVDRRDAVRALVDRLLAEIPSEEARAEVLAFFAGAGEDERLVLLQGDVEVTQEDSTMAAGWVVFSESRPEEFVSVADRETGLQLRVVIEDEETPSETAAP